MPEPKQDASTELFEHDTGYCGHVELLGLRERHPDKLDQLRVGPGHTLDTMRNRARIHGEKARVKPSWAAGRSNRATNEMQEAQVRQDAGLCESRPGTGRNPVDLDCARAEQKSRLLECLTDGCESKRARLCRAWACKTLHQLRLHVLMNGPGNGHFFVGGINPAAREHKHSRHEFVTRVAFPQQHLGDAFRPVNQNERGCVLWPNEVRRRLAFRRLEAVHAFQRLGMGAGHDLPARLRGLCGRACAWTWR